MRSRGVRRARPCVRGVRERVEGRVDRAGARARRRAGRRSARGAVARQRLDVLARAGHQRAGAGQHHRDVGAEAHRRGRAGSRARRPAEASRSAAAALLEPPAIPAAIGIRLAIVSRCGGASQPVAARNSLQRAQREVLAGRRPGRSTSSRSPAGSSVTSSASRVGWTSETSGCRPSAPRRADQQAEVDLAGASVLSTAAPTARATAAARATRRGRRRGGRAPRALRVCARGCPASAFGASESERASALRRCAKPCWTSLRRLSGGAGLWRLRPTSTESTFGIGMEDAARDLLDDADVARELGEHRRDAVGATCSGRPRSAGRPPSAPSPPSCRTLSSSIVLQDHRGGDAVGQVGDDLVRRGVERLQVELERVGEVQRRVRVRVQRVAQRELEVAVELDDVDVARRARRGTR